jgi:hypothetical protein
LWRPERHGACLLPWSLLFYFCQLLPRVILLVFPLVSAAIDDENYFKFKWLWHKAVAGQGRQADFGKMQDVHLRAAADTPKPTNAPVFLSRLHRACLQHSWLGALF